MVKAHWPERKSRACLYQNQNAAENGFFLSPPILQAGRTEDFENPLLEAMAESLFCPLE
jgi:hypothetical protein